MRNKRKIELLYTNRPKKSQKEKWKYQYFYEIMVAIKKFLHRLRPIKNDQNLYSVKKS
jgi:hypothetical protein